MSSTMRLRATSRLVLAVAAFLLAAPASLATEKISRFGRYEGYSEAIYDGIERTSRYVTGRDETRLAVDVILPTRNGKVAEEPLPVLWTHHRYLRSSDFGGQVFTILGLVPWLQRLSNHGYVIVAVDIRGCGASFGSWPGLFSEEETRDAYDITEWLAEQPFCDGNVGMFGRSYLGITQYMAASTRPPHLKAIFPEMAVFDLYDLIYAGGIYHHDLMESWSVIVHHLDGNGDKVEGSPTGPWAMMKPVAVDEDRSRSLLEAALAEHRKNRDVVQIFSPMHFRDSVDSVRKSRLYEVWSPSSYLEGIEGSGVAIYHLGGWLDVFTRDTFLFQHNLGNPQKLVMGPWFHTQSHAFDQGAEAHRWFDHWLKGIDNGIMDEDPITYYVQGAPEAEAWRSTSKWPLPGERRVKYVFAQGPSGSVESVNDGFLLATSYMSQGASSHDELVVDYSATSGRVTRWSNAYGNGAMGPAYVDLGPNDRKCLTWTTPVLTEDVEVTGHPLVSLWVSSSSGDADLFVVLEEVLPGGESRYVTEGALRASHRKVGEGGYSTFGFPYRSHREADASPLPEKEPTLVSFDLIPTSNLFDAGNRIRVSLACADRDNARTSELSPPPRVRIYRGDKTLSFLELPVIPAAAD